ncbi:MAG: hypothetical protein K1W22_05205 [Lachnospiraceae bacterium]
MNSKLFHTLMELLSRADDNDLRIIVSSLSAYWLGKGNISIDEFQNITASIFNDATTEKD